MKRILPSLICLLFVATCFFACTSEVGPDPEPTPEEGVTGTLEITSAEVAITKSVSTEVGYGVSDLKSVTITVAKDDIILEDYNKIEVTISSYTDTEVTISGLELPEGEGYEIVAFELKNEDETTTFAIPIEGSAGESWVQEALPISFDITADATTTVQLEVVTTVGLSPDIFGYSGLSFTDMSPKTEAYLRSIENIFTSNMGDSVKHFYKEGGIPAYSEVYSKHQFNNYIVTDYVSNTIRHYYTDDDVPVTKIDFISSRGDVVEYEVVEHESGYISEITETSDGYTSLIKFNEAGQQTSWTSNNVAGTRSESEEYTYSDEGYLLEERYYSQGGVLSTVVYVVDTEGNVTESLDSYNGELRNKCEFEYDSDGKKIRSVEYNLTWNEEGEIEDELSLLSTSEFTYNGDLLTSSVTTYSDYWYLREEVSYEYQGDVAISRETTSIYSDETRSVSTSIIDPFGYSAGDNSSYGYDVEATYDYKGNLKSRTYTLDDNRTVVVSYNEGDSYDIASERLYSESGDLLKMLSNGYVYSYSSDSKLQNQMSLKNSDRDYVIENFFLKDYSVNLESLINPKDDDDYQLILDLYRVYFYNDNGYKEYECILYGSINFDYDRSQDYTFYRIYDYSDEMIVSSIYLYLEEDCYEFTPSAVTDYKVEKKYYGTNEIISTVNYNRDGSIIE